jgi:hypothetical protein
MKTITTDVERDLLTTIIEHLKSHSLKGEDARKLAREFLTLLPLQNKKDLLEKLYKLSQTHTETKSIYLKYAQPYEEEERQKKLTLMSEHIKNGQIQNAIIVAKS